MTYKIRFSHVAWLTAVLGLTGCRSMLSQSAKVESVIPGHSLTSAFQRPFGKYLGYLHTSDDSKMPVTIDLVPGSSDSGLNDMRGILRFHLGGFGSTEFASFYFPKIVEGFDGKINFGGAKDASPDLRVENARLVDGRFSASLYFPSTTSDELPKSGFVEAILFGNGEGRMDDVLSLGGSAPALGSLSGQYSAVCDGRQTVLQLEYSRWNSSSGEVVGGFRPDGVLTGRLGVTNLASCKADSANCSQLVFRAGAYDPFTGKLLLQSSGGDTLCHRNGSSITCDSCVFSRVEPSKPEIFTGIVNESSKLPKFHSRAEETIFDSGPSVDLDVDASAMAGGLYGYLHHESTNLYQPISLNITYNPDSATYSAVSALYFGVPGNNEFIAYRFDQFPKSELAGRMVLDGPGEAFLVITASGSKGLNGVWYSKTHGRIGTVSFARNSMPPLMVDEKLLMHGLSGKYSGEYWQFELKVAANVSENSREFYPLRMFGSAREKGDSQKRRLIQDGTYDFYSGSVALRLDDGRTVVGRIRDGSAELFWPPWPRLGPVLEAQELQVFNRVDQSDRTIAARK